MHWCKTSYIKIHFPKLTGDQSPPHDLTTAEVDDRVNEMLESEDSDLIWDLRIRNHSHPEMYEVYLTKIKEFIARAVDTSVHERSDKSGTRRN